MTKNKNWHYSYCWKWVQPECTVLRYFGVTVDKADACNLDVTCNVPKLLVNNFKLIIRD